MLMAHPLICNMKYFAEKKTKYLQMSDFFCTFV